MTIKQLAAELKTSKTTIKNIMKRLEIQPQKKLDKGQEVIFLSEAEIDRIKEHYLEKHPAETPKTLPQTPKRQPKKLAETPKTLPQKLKTLPQTPKIQR